MLDAECWMLEVAIPPSAIDPPPSTTHRPPSARCCWPTNSTSQLTSEAVSSLRELVARADHDATRLRLDPHHVARLAERQPQALALADGELLEPAMATDHRPVGSHQLARRVDVPAPLADEAGMVLIGYEADFLAVSLGCHRKAEPTGQRANFFLAVSPDGKHQPRQ